MGFHNYVSENEAAQISGVGIATLRRFVEAGYLKCERDSDGLPLFSTADLIAVFGAPAQQFSSSLNAESGATPPQGSAISAEAGSPQTEAADNVTADTASAAIMQPTSPQAISLQAAASPAESPAPTVTAAPAPSAGAIQMLEAEVQRLKNVVKLQEQLLDHRDGQIQDLREQREWLHRRLERSEEKAERDQLLLLAETQTIRKLIILESERKTPFRQFLEWMGFASPTKPTVVEGASLPGPRPLKTSTPGNRQTPPEGQSRAA